MFSRHTEVMNKHFFLSKRFFENVFVDTENAVYPQPCQKNFAGRLNSSRAMWKIDEKTHTFYPRSFFLKRFFWTLGMQFGQPSRESSKQKAKLFAPCEKMLGNRYIVQKKLRRKVPMDTWKAILTTPLKRVWQKRKNFSSMTGNAENNSIFLFLSSPKKCCRHVLSNFDNTAQKNLPDSQKNFPHSPKLWNECNFFSKSFFSQTNHLEI